jgi:hypothetical protein
MAAKINTVATDCLKVQKVHEIKRFKHWLLTAELPELLNS